MKNKIIQYTVDILGVMITLFHLVALVFIPLVPTVFRPTHLLMALAVVYLTKPAIKGKSIGLSNFFFLVASIVTMSYAFVELEDLLGRAGIFTTQADIIMGIIAIIVVLEAARRTVGVALPIIALLFLGYAFWGQHIPGIFGHNGYNIKRIISAVYTYDGIFGTALDTAATFVAIFIIFSAFLERTGAGDVFLELAKGVAGKTRGGPAKVAVVSSALFGSISGSAVANVASTGSITIPLMKKLGYKPEFAGAVEAAASTGGQIMPPIMAAGAFLMAQYLSTNYLTIVTAAVIPALMYFGTVWFTIDFYSGAHGLLGLSDDEIPSVKKVLKKDGIILLPLIVLILTLVVFRYSAIKAAFYSIVVTVAICTLDKKRRLKASDWIEICVSSAKGIAPIASACACAGIVIGVITLTGLGLKIATMIISFSHGILIVALILSMVTAIIFGMGLPTTVSYILCVSVLAPVLIDLGVLPIAAHMFIFYFACLSGITPPVALASYTGAGIAGSNPMRTAFISTRLALTAFILPYLFVYRPALLMEGSISQIVMGALPSIIACLTLAAGLEGFFFDRLSPLERIAFATCTVLMMWPTLVITDYLGIALFVVILIWLRSKHRREKA